VKPFLGNGKNDRNRNKKAIIAANNNLASHYHEGLSLDEITEVMYPEIEADKEGCVKGTR
jgi:hypothetical protein